MKREFTDLLILHFDRAMAEADSRYERSRSASKGGGATLRSVVPNVCQILIGFETIPQREMVALFVAWAPGKKLPNLQALEDARLSKGHLIHDPDRFVRTSDQGFLNASDLGQSSNVLELEPFPVPASVVLHRITTDPTFAAYVSAVHGGYSASNSQSEAPILSWEQYFMLQDRKIIDPPSVSDVLAPLVHNMKRQLIEVFLPYANRIAHLRAQ